MDYKAMAVAIKLCGSTPKFDQCKKECPYWDDGHMTVFWPFVWASALCMVIFDMVDSIVRGGRKNVGAH